MKSRVATFAHRATPACPLDEQIEAFVPTRPPTRRPPAQPAAHARRAAEQRDELATSPLDHLVGAGEQRGKWRLLIQSAS